MFTNLKLVENWKQGWKWISTNAMAINMMLLSSWMAMPDTFQQAMPVEVLLYIAITLLVLGFIGRFVDQGTGSK